VQSGELSVFGSLITAASGSLEVCADERCGGALLLEPGAALGTVPLAASSTVVFTLMRCTGSGAGFGGPPATPNPRQQQKDASESGSGGGSRRQLGFEAWLSSDPAAPAAPPPLPPLWQQAADEVDETLGQLPPGMPPVIVVCGAKKVGKSTFARFLANSLLTRHASVAYLDTGRVLRSSLAGMCWPPSTDAARSPFYL
jgi:polynucleotide 5'-hydroxyl-kinase GRC3/NOL9